MQTFCDGLQEAAGRLMKKIETGKPDEMKEDIMKTHTLLNANGFKANRIEVKTSRMAGFAVALLGIAAVNTYGTPIVPDTELGSAAGFAALSYGNFSLSNPSGYINGNLGEETGNGTTGGSAGVNGNVYLGSGATFGGPVSGTTYNNSALPASALTQAGSAATYYKGLTPNFTAAPTAGALAAGVYNISGNWSINGGTFTLTPGAVYVFNILGNLTMNTGASALFINGTPSDVIFNVAGSVSTSGGSSTYPMIDGIVLAQGSISLTPGFVDGEVISVGSSINIASEGAVQGSANVPDASSTFALLGLAFAGLYSLGRMFQTRPEPAPARQ